jgi:hypothetical protein|tara:strand:- start:495 stop:674 length:180 start_codon:yes stop_codon:yes gene_type:complete
MRVDRHRDIAEDLEAELLEELKGITQQLRGNMKQMTRADYSGRSSKVIEIEYEINEGNN